MRTDIMRLGCSTPPQLLPNGQIPLIATLRFVGGMVGNRAAIGAGCWGRTYTSHRRCGRLAGGWISKRERIGGCALRGAVAEIGPKGIVVAGQQGKAVELVGVVIEANPAPYNRLVC